MTLREISERNHIPMTVLKEYERWGLRNIEGKKGGKPAYDDTDLRYLSMIMTLHDTGFSEEEVETYMRFLLDGNSTERARLNMLNTKRKDTLEEIHLKEKQLDFLDYLRHEIKG